ncbi:MAG: hypothetical protein JNL74_11900 [Fibrobacteres bacterium]|nr:hypothetical protein [Fibrobacterota bacterium]
MNRFIWTALLIAVFLQPAFPASEPRMANVEKLLDLLYAIPAYQAYVVPDADRETIMHQVVNNAGDELPIFEQYEPAIEGYYVNFDSDREYYRSYTDELTACKAAFQKAFSE